MIKNRNIRKALPFALEGICFLALLFADLASKSFVFSMLEGKGSFEVFPGILTFYRVMNTGASFGMFDGQSALLISISILAVLLLIALLIIFPKTHKLFRYALIFVASGALGNAVDRIAFDYVRDFIDYTMLKTWFGIDFAVGNIADIILCVGVVMLIVYIFYLFQKDSDKRNFCPLWKLIKLK